MYQFNAQEIEILMDALTQALASNKRMQIAKPKFASVWNQIEADLTALKLKIATPQKTK